MEIKAIYPFWYGDRYVLPGETIDVPEGQALEIIGNVWAVSTAEEPTKETPKKKVKHEQ